MSSYLYRLGRWSFEHRKMVLGFWLAVLVGITVLAQAVKKPESDAFNVPGTESQEALDLLDERFPGTGGATARIVFAAPEGHTLAEKRYENVVQPTIDAAQKVPQTLTTGEQFAQSAQLSKDTYADLQFLVPLDELKDSTKDALERVADPARDAGLQVEFSGGVISSAAEESTSTETIGVVVAFFVLLVAFGSALTAGIPLLTALIGVAIGVTAISASTAVFEINSTAPTLALMLGLAVGIDYAVFIISRHRQQLRDGMDPAESVGRAVGTAGSAVVFAGTTVIIALVGLLVVGIPFLTVMGLAAAGTVALAVLIALTLLPAILGFGRRRVRAEKAASGEGLGHKWAEFVTRRPLVAILSVIAVLGACAIPALELRQALPDDSTKPKDSTENKSYVLLSNAFGPGFTGPLTLVIDFGDRKDTKQIANNAAEELKTFPGVAGVSPPALNEKGDVAIIIVTPEGAPASQSTKDLVANLRSEADKIRAQYDVSGLVTGTTAINIDTSDKLTAALPVFLILVVGIAMFLLALVFRSVPVPIKAVLGFLLTIGASLGAVVWVFQHGNFGADLLGVETTSPIVSFLPTLMIAILFGLAMDYEVFLVSRMREEFVHTGKAHESVVGGFQASARVVTAAGLIMISVFSGFILSDDVVIKSIGFALAFGVLVDAFLVRMTLVPAVLALLGPRAWWLPRWMQRMPNLDIEGEKLLHDLEDGTIKQPAPVAKEALGAK
jgi:putative drug exporter of the RND superfamily